MKLFLSHATEDAAVAKFLKAAFVSVGVETFILPDDAPPGGDWMEQIKEGLANSDELVTLVSPAALNKPWIAAEWACFWFSGRHRTPLLVGTQISDLWDGMSPSQAVDLLDPARSLAFFRRLAAITNRQPEEGVLGLAQEVARQIPEIQQRSRISNVDAVLKKISTSLKSGSTNVKEDDVRAAIEAGRISDIVVLATSDHAAVVKQRQVAVALVRAGRPGEAFRIASAIHNRNEVKNVVIAMLDNMRQTLGEESEEWIFLYRIHSYLGAPQLRVIRQHMLELGIYPRGPWGEEADEASGEDYRP